MRFRMRISGVGCGWGWVCIYGRRATTSSPPSWTRTATRRKRDCCGRVRVTEPALAFNVRGRGRHYRHPVTGEDVPSVTNVIWVLDKPALPRWAAKVVAEQAWLLRGTLDELGRDEAVDVLKGAPWRKSTRAADRGTTIHDYLHARAQGVEPPELEGDAARYQKAADQFLDDYQPEFLYTEATVFGDGYAGTFDFMAVIDGVTVLGDYKTSKDLYPEIALQLAA